MSTSNTFQVEADELQRLVHTLRYSTGDPLLDTGGLRAPVDDYNVYDFDPIESPRHAEAYMAAVALLERLTRVSSRQYRSYQLKHLVERVAASKGKRIYIPTGVAIAAAFKMGLVTKKELLNDARKGIHAQLHISPAEASRLDPCVA